MAGSFFDRRPPAPRPPLPLDRRVGQRAGHFRLAPPDRLLVQAGDLRDQARASTPQAIRLDRGIPPTLGFAEATQQQVHLLVQHPLGVRFPGLASGTLTDTDSDRVHAPHPFDQTLDAPSYTPPIVRPRSLPPKREVIP
jgi:hypothetical protein